MHIFSLLAAIFMAAIAQLFFKSFSLSKIGSENIFLYLLNYKLILGFSLYFLSAALYIIALKKIDLSVAYPTVSLSYIFVILLSYFIFGEELTNYKILGSILILLGASLMWK
jgi:drug/metabolite transporter (DMT)-like permease